MTTPAPMYAPPPYLYQALNNDTSEILAAINNQPMHIRPEILGAIDRRALDDNIRDLKSSVETHTLGLRDAVERNGNLSVHATERNASQLEMAVERNGATNSHYTERVGRDILSSVEKNAGESRLTTVVSDAASRQAANDSARDIMATVERNGANGLTATERNGGDTRFQMASLVADAKASVVDSRGLLSESINRSANEIISIANQTSNDIKVGIAQTSNDIKSGLAQTSWETRQDIAALQREAERMHSMTAAISDKHYASLLLEGQKSKDLIALQMADSKYEALKNSQCLSSQMAQNTAMIATQQAAAVADAKYEALKTQQLLSSQIAECCCSVKLQVDQRAVDTQALISTLDTNRLRDNLIVTRDETNFYRVLDRLGDRDRFRDYRDDRRDDRRYRDEGGRGGGDGRGDGH